MFTLVADESDQRTGIKVHLKRKYVFAQNLLRGHVWHDSTDKNFIAFVEPNYNYMVEITDGENGTKLRHEFDNARTHAIYLGVFRSLDVVDVVLDDLHTWYRKILSRHGASHRFLVENEDSYRLISHEQAAPTHYCDAIIRARNVQAFDMMQRGKALDHHTVVARIMPVFLQALGLREYYVSHDLSDFGHNEVRFVIKDVGAFAFFEPLTEGEPAFMERYSYSKGEYYRNFSGPVNGEIMKNKVFGWLVDAARDLETLTREDIDSYMDELILDVRRAWITQEAGIEQTMFADGGGRTGQAAETPPSNIFHLGQYRVV